MRWLFLLLLVFAGNVYATTYNVTCSGTIDTALQNAINSAVDGDIINISSGSCTLTSAVSFTNKDITIQGQGAASTTITCTGCFAVTNTSNPATWRITAMKLTHGSSDANSINIYATGSDVEISGWRIDHVTFTYQTTNSGNAGQCIFIYGMTYGVIDNNTFNTTTGRNGCAPLYQYAYADSEYTTDFVCDAVAANSDWCGGEKSFEMTDNAGTARSVYFEDNTVDFSITTGGYQPFVQDALYGASIVMRHNTLTNVYGQNHATRYNLLGGKNAEIYQNDWNCEATSSRCWFFRSGTAFFFMNKWSTGGSIDIDIQRLNNNNDCTLSPDPTPMSYCDGTESYDTNTDSGTGWKCLGQPGRGAGFPASDQGDRPLYEWKNGDDSTCITNGACDDLTDFTLNGACNATEMVKYLKTIGTSPAHTGSVVDYVNSANVGNGTLASRPSTCTKWSAYWATDQGGDWDKSNGTSNDGCLYQCTATDTWSAQCYYTPYEYPHPTRGETPSSNQIKFIVFRNIAMFGIGLGLLGSLFYAYRVTRNARNSGGRFRPSVGPANNGRVGIGCSSANQTAH